MTMETSTLTVASNQFIEPIGPYKVDFDSIHCQRFNSQVPCIRADFQEQLTDFQWAGRVVQTLIQGEERC